MSNEHSKRLVEEYKTSSPTKFINLCSGIDFVGQEEVFCTKYGEEISKAILERHTMPNNTETSYYYQLIQFNNAYLSRKAR